MSELDTALDMRAQLRGVLLREARQSAGRSVKDCAERLGITPAAYTAYEAGEKSPSLPELELLAYSLDIPLAHFWGQTTLAQETGRRPAPPDPVVRELRDRMLGARLRQARVAAKLKLKDFAASLGISSGLLTDFEFGQKPVPLPDLEVIANRLGLKLEDLLEPEGVIGEWESAHRLFQGFKQLPPDLREFVVSPVNEQYLRLAQRLSQMPADQLRAIATGLLDLTS